MSSLQKVKDTLGKVLTERNLLRLLLTSSVVLNLLFAYTLAQKRSDIDLLIQNRSLTVGEIAAKLTARESDGRLTSVDLANQITPTVLYLYSRSCYWCAQNESNLTHLSEQASGRYKLIALSLDKDWINGDLPSLDTSTHRLFDPTTETKLSLDLKATPTTILFSKVGEVQKIWKGAYTTEREKDIESTLGIELPGLAESAPSSLSGQ